MASMMDDRVVFDDLLWLMASMVDGWIDYKKKLALVNGIYRNDEVDFVISFC